MALVVFEGGPLPRVDIDAIAFDQGAGSASSLLDRWGGRNASRPIVPLDWALPVPAMNQ